MSLLLRAQPCDAPLHPFLASGRLADLPEPEPVEDHALLYVLGPAFDLLAEDDASAGGIRLQWQVRLPTLPAQPDLAPITFVRPPGIDALLPFGILPDPGPFDRPLAARVREALAAVFSPEARVRIHGLFALARLHVDRIGRRARLAVRADGGFSLSYGPPPGIRIPLLSRGTPEETARLVSHVGGARGLLNGQIVDPVAGVDISHCRGRSAHERLADRAAAAALLEAAGIPLDRLPSRPDDGTSI